MGLEQYLDLFSSYYMHATALAREQRTMMVMMMFILQNQLLRLNHSDEQKFLISSLHRYSFNSDFLMIAQIYNIGYLGDGFYNMHANISYSWEYRYSWLEFIWSIAIFFYNKLDYWSIAV